MLRIGIVVCSRCVFSTMKMPFSVVKRDQRDGCAFHLIWMPLESPFSAVGQSVPCF